MSLHPSSPPRSPETVWTHEPGGQGPRSIVALGFSPEARVLLQRLEATGLLAAIRWPGSAPSPADWLRQHWDQAEAVVAVGACGLIVRLIAPLLEHKQSDPAVVVLDPAGRTPFPCWGVMPAVGKPWLLGWLPCSGPRWFPPAARPPWAGFPLMPSAVPGAGPVAAATGTP